MIGLLFALPLVRSMTRVIPPELPVYGTIPDFQLTDETGARFARRKMNGQVWVANFIFTRCPTACPVLSTRMQRIQRRTRFLGQTFHMISFSVDPEHDTPSELFAYARRYHANPRGWNFLTGQTKDQSDQLERVVVDSFKIAMTHEKKSDANAPDNWMDIVHGEHFVLVDQAARIRGYYEANDEGVDRLVADIGRLVNTPLAAPPAKP